MKRYVYIISDGTGLTAESLANSLLTQFEQLEFEKQIVPYIDTIDKADSVLSALKQCTTETNSRPIIFMTIVNPKLSAYIKHANACVFDLFNTFLSPLEQELSIKSSYTVGRTHGVANTKRYDRRIEAVNFALSHDDGIKISDYDKADIILIGVSRSGKTPSCLYMALQFGILAANYPLTEDELSFLKLPKSLQLHQQKLFGLTIDPIRLHQIRSERRPNSQYASLEQCRKEIMEVEAIYHRENLPFLNSTRFSIEEITTKIMAAANLKRKL